MTTVPPLRAFPANDRVVLYDVDWEMYMGLRQNLGQNPIRLTYDGRNLEIMSPSRWHEFAGRFLGRMIAMLAFELHIPIATGGSTTFQRADLKRGLEPDECFWLTHESRVRGKRDIDLEVDPPPDLAIEIDISTSRLDRPRIYAALLVPEIWRYDGENLHVELQQADGTFRASETSECFPFLPVHELPRFLSQVEHDGELQTMHAFVDWIRERGF